MKHSAGRTIANLVEGLGSESVWRIASFGDLGLSDGLQPPWDFQTEAALQLLPNSLSKVHVLRRLSELRPVQLNSFFLAVDVLHELRLPPVGAVFIPCSVYLSKRQLCSSGRIGHKENEELGGNSHPLICRFRTSWANSQLLQRHWSDQIGTSYLNTRSTYLTCQNWWAMDNKQNRAQMKSIK